MGTRETQIVETIHRLAASGARRWVRLGIGDDTAVVRPVPSTEEELLTTDQIIENTHFRYPRHPPRSLGYKTLARGLSDIAAMGGAPRHFLLSLCLPHWATVPWLKQYLSGLFRLSKSSGTPLVGGDVARGDRFVANITVIGSVPKGAALLRSGARRGDVLYVSGRLGGSVLGLEGLETGAAAENAVRRHLYPQPRLSLGRFLRARLRATAAMDVSDGLSMDLLRLTKASGVGAEIEAPKIPCFKGASLAQALHGGEEYELLFTLSPSVRVPHRFEKIPLTPIGRIRTKPGVVLRSNGRVQELQPMGFQHFDVAY